MSKKIFSRSFRNFRQYFSTGLRLQNNEKYEQAIEQYEKYLLEIPTDIGALSNKGLCLYYLGRMDEAVECFKISPEVSEENSGFYFNKAVIFQYLAKYEVALDAINRAIECKKHDAILHFCRGTIMQAKKSWDQAMISYDFALSINGKYVDALSNRALLFQSMGDMTKASADYELALSIEARKSLQLVYARHLIYSGSSTTAVALLANLALEDSEIGINALIYLAIIYYTEFHFDKAFKLLSQIENRYGHADKALRIYWKFLRLLLTSTARDSSYALKSVSREHLYVIGESHSLSVHGVDVVINGRPLTAKALWIEGIKLFHISENKENRYKSALRNRINQTPSNSFLMFTIGEIDTRLDEGFLKHYREQSNALFSNIKDVVFRALSFIKQLTVEKNAHIIVQGIPHPFISDTQHLDYDSRLRKKIINLINIELKETSRIFGFYFLDVYRMTTSEDGELNPNLHIDSCHLKPSSIANAFINHLISPEGTPKKNNPTVTMKKASTAIYFQHNSYSSNLPQPMGRNVAGESFLRGFLTYSCTEQCYALTPTREDVSAFKSALKTFNYLGDAFTIDKSQLKDLTNLGTLFYPGPSIAHQAWRRTVYGDHNWSVCGITHTTSSAGAMDALVELITAPVQPWDAVICTSTTVKDNVTRLLQAQVDYLQSRLGVSRVVLPLLPVIPLGVHTADFVFSDAQRAAARAALGVSADTLVVLFMGRLSFHAKAHPLAMYQALEVAAKASGKKVVLVECGWHANEFIEKAYADAARLACPSVQVRTLDGRKAQDRQTAWAGADVFCSLSDNIQETFGIVPVEAMAAGLPVVVSDWDGYKDTVRDGVDGFRIPTLMPQAGLGGDLALRHALEIDTYDMHCGHTCSLVAVDVQAAAAALTRLLTSSELRSQMGEAGRKRAVEVYDWKTIISQYEALWAEQTQLRLNGGAIAGKSAARSLAHPWPARMDPFHGFASYSTTALGPDTFLALVDKTASAAMLRANSYRSLAMVNFAEYVLPTPVEIESILNRASERPQRAEYLIQNVPSDRQAYVFRSLTWLIKLGILAPSINESLSTQGAERQPCADQ